MAVTVDTARYVLKTSEVDWRAFDWIRQVDGENRTISALAKHRIRSSSLLHEDSGHLVLTAKQLEGEWTLSAEASIPKLLTGSNVKSASISMLQEATELVTPLLHQAGADRSPEREPRLTRLDVVRDFDAGSHLGALLHGLSKVEVDTRRTRDLYVDSTAGGALTLTVRSKRAGSGYVYDKHRESLGVAPEGASRLECRERRATLREAGIVHASDVEQHKIRKLAEDRMIWAGFDRTVMMETEFLQSVMQNGALSEGAKLQLIGYATLVEKGYHYSIERNRRRRIKKAAKDIGATMGAKARAGTAALWKTLRLDLDHGLVVGS